MNLVHFPLSFYLPPSWFHQIRGHHMQLIRSVTTVSPADLLTPEQAAKFLGLSVKTLATWRSTGRHALPFIRCGARIRYQRAELDAWLAKRHHTSTAPRGKS
ncbi:hypothetical protein PPUJ20188_34860 [Pseudomonas putida]|nr:hypothetical protein PPUJ20188_34860 [Pseudomonas putida]